MLSIECVVLVIASLNLTFSVCRPVPVDVLIVQETYKQTPDDNARGGTLTFEFASPVLFSDIGLFDIKSSDLTQKMIFTYEGGGVETFTYRSVGTEDGGDNGVTRVIANKRNVRKVDVVFKSSGAVEELNFCPIC